MMNKTSSNGVVPSLQSAHRYINPYICKYSLCPVTLVRALRREIRHTARPGNNLHCPCSRFVTFPNAVKEGKNPIFNILSVILSNSVSESPVIPRTCAL